MTDSLNYITNVDFLDVDLVGKSLFEMRFKLKYAFYCQFKTILL